MSPNYFDQLEAELREAVPRVAGDLSAAESDRRQSRRWRMRGPLLALNAAVVIAVTVALIVVLGHHRSTQPTTAPPSTHIGRGPRTENIHPPGANPTLAQLLDNFAILRRPQTAADRSWKPNCDCGRAATQLSRYTRLAQTLPGGDRLFFDLQRYNLGGQENLAAGSYTMEYDVVSPDGDVDSEGFGPNTQFTIYPSPVGDHVYISVIPDGVSTATWRFSCQAGPKSCAGTHPFTVTAPVVNNTAARRVTKRACLAPSELTPAQRRNPNRVRRLITHCDRPTGITWRDASDQVVATFPQGYGNLAAAPFVKGARATRSLHILSSDGIAAVRFGQPASATVLMLDQRLGSRTVTQARVPGCEQETEMVWTSPAVASPLTIYYRNSRFVGYQYGAPVNETGLLRGPGTVLTTDRGLTLDDTVGQARRLYGTTFHAHAISGRPHNNGGGVWTVRSDGRPVGGALLPIRYPMRTVTPANPIATISAGQVGCS